MSVERAEMAEVTDSHGATEKRRTNGVRFRPPRTPRSQSLWPFDGAAEGGSRGVLAAGDKRGPLRFAFVSGLQHSSPGLPRRPPVQPPPGGPVAPLLRGGTFPPDASLPLPHRHYPPLVRSPPRGRR